MPESNDRGALTEAVFYILLSLYSPLHGYGIMQYVTALSKGRVNLGPGTLYGALSTLVEKGLIAAVLGEDTGRKTVYQITAAGRRAVKEELIRLRELVQVGEEISGRGEPV